VPAGQPARDEQPEPVRVREIEVRRVRQSLVDCLELLGGDAEAAVFDLDGEAVGHAIGADLHAGG
jgi:hypothetical protein